LLVFEKIKLWSQPVYVHQLQNLYYALSNEELDIQLGRFANIAMMGPIDFFVNRSKGIPVPGYLCKRVFKTVNLTNTPQNDVMTDRSNKLIFDQGFS
jgi:hypothetical protein